MTACEPGARRASMLTIAWLGCGLALSSPSLWSAPIGPQGFSSGATVINFDNLVGGHIFPLPPTGEIIANQYAPQGATFNNFGRELRANNTLTALHLNPSWPNVAWANEGGGDPGTGANYLEVNFSVPVYRVGFGFGMSADARLQLDLVGTSGLVLDRQSTDNNRGTFGHGFLGGATGQLIAKAIIRSTRPSNGTGLNFSFDNFAFEAMPGGAQSASISVAQPVAQVLGNNVAGAARLDFGAAVQSPGTLAVSYQATTTTLFDPAASGYAPFNFALPTPGGVQMWDIGFDGQLAPGGTVHVSLQYDATGLTPAQQSALRLRHFTGGQWIEEASTVDLAGRTISADLHSFSPLVLSAAVPEPGTVALLGAAGAGLGLFLWRRRNPTA